jgi:hypothetical protein
MPLAEYHKIRSWLGDLIEVQTVRDQNGLLLTEQIILSCPTPQQDKKQ